MMIIAGVVRILEGLITVDRATLKRRAQIDKPPQGGWITYIQYSASFSWLIDMSATVNRRVVARAIPYQDHHHTDMLIVLPFLVGKGKTRCVAGLVPSSESCAGFCPVLYCMQIRIYE